MSQPALRHPTLVMAPSAGGEVPTIRVGRCACGHVFHPPHSYGCEGCGRDGAATQSSEMDARGVLTALATVHVHPKLSTPFALGRVTLDGGLAIEAWLGGAPTEAMLGTRVRGTLVTDGAADAQILDLRFVPDLRFAPEGSG